MLQLKYLREQREEYKTVVLGINTNANNSFFSIISIVPTFNCIHSLNSNKKTGYSTSLRNAAITLTGFGKNMTQEKC